MRAGEFITEDANPARQAAIAISMKKAGKKPKHVDEEALDENLHKWFKEKWVRFGPDGKIRGDCARGDDSEGKPKCLPQSKAHSLGKKGRASAAARKRREDPNPERSGKAINVNTKKKTNEEQLDELKCWPGYTRVKGVPAGAPGSCKKKTNEEGITEEKCPHCGGPMFSEMIMNEKKDACYYKVKSRYKVWPSAYASGALVKCRKKGAKNWGTKSESIGDESMRSYEFEGVVEGLNESQTFPFEQDKNNILLFINNVLNNEPHNSRTHNPFYGLIVGNTKVGDAAKIGLGPEIASAWKSNFNQKPWIGDPGEPWRQIDMGDNFPSVTGSDRTLNFYITVAKEKNNVINFLNNILKLKSYLEPISTRYKTPIKFKTHALLDSFIGHNDSLKVYYYDPKMKYIIVAAVNKWLSDSRIATGNRTHSHGVDVKSGGGSFGQIVSNHIYDTFTKLIQTHGNKFTPEQYFQWLKQNFNKLISQVKQKEEIKEGMTEDWQKVNKSDKTDGMSRKAVKAYRRENPGSKLKTAVTTKPSKLKKGSKDANRRKSFCARMSGMKKAHASAKTKRDPDSPINKALRRWNCE